MKRNELARQAFWGVNEALYMELCERDGYIVNDDGIEEHNGMTLARAIELMNAMSDQDIEELMALGTI
jgi:hypothetical protein